MNPFPNERKRLDINNSPRSRSTPRPTSSALSQPASDPLRVALEYAASTLENEYRSDPTLQDLARSLRAALEVKT